MRKLKLESLHVESFETTAAAPGLRGTVQAHADSDESVCFCQMTEGWACETWDLEACGDTQYMDCTMGCTDFKTCVGPGTC
ncbi:MAG TPA: pinensin family lanthipeptide [Longimicrobium sp.]|nr:pinensin family lanthipeptide [Longimicrobium sp.]